MLRLFSGFSVEGFVFKGVALEFRVEMLARQVDSFRGFFQATQRCLEVRRTPHPVIVV